VREPVSDPSLAHPEPVCDLIGPHPLITQSDDGLGALLSLGLSSQLRVLNRPRSARMTSWLALGLPFFRQGRLRRTSDLGQRFREDHGYAGCKVLR
jgi:hypothetical protein